MSTFEEKLDRYAELAVRVGASVQRGQRVILRTPVECAPFARKVVAAAYRAGARLVDTMWGDDEVARTRFRLAPRDSFDEIPTWQLDGLNEASEQGAAIITVYASDPDLMKDQDPALVARQAERIQAYLAPHTQRVMSGDVAWTVIAAPVPEWAIKIFPEMSREKAVARLWDELFAACRVDGEDPVARWDDHKRALVSRREMLTEKQYTELRYRAPGTELTVGLPERHVWLGGVSRTTSGTDFVANLPTEEVFTMPHKDRVTGKVASTKPLSHAGKLIEGFRFTFEEGRIVDARAQNGQAVLDRLLSTDDGARRLGEVALVPHGSPISRSGLLYYNTLYDENASSHLAIGRAYSTCLAGGSDMSQDALESAGANHSLTHVDFMIGSGEMDVDGLRPNGELEPVMRGGEWAE